MEQEGKALALCPSGGQPSFAEMIDWSLVRKSVLIGLQGMRAPPAIQARRLAFTEAARQVNSMSNFASEAMREFQRRQLQPAARDSVLEALADELIAKWQDKAKKMVFSEEDLKNMSRDSKE